MGQAFATHARRICFSGFQSRLLSRTLGQGRQTQEALNPQVSNVGDPMRQGFTLDAIRTTPKLP